MASTTARLRSKRWTRDEYFISTDPSLIPLAALNAMFASDAMYWAYALPEDDLKRAIDNSLCFGLYQGAPDSDQGAAPGFTFVGFARLVTDFTTFAWLTDVAVDSGRQGRGLGEWMMKCVQECVDSMPHLRATMFLAARGRGAAFYERVMGTREFGTVDEQGLAVLSRPGSGKRFHDGS